MERVNFATPIFKPEGQVQNEHTAFEAQRDFSKFLTDAIKQVNDAQVEADAKTEQLVNNEDVDLHEVMIAAEKASLSLQITLEVRNKVVEAYQEMMRMQL